MNSKALYETNEDLLTLARGQGHRISRTQLVRWHRAGLLPRPRQLPLRDARGTRSLYPAGTGEQLLLLCTLRASERRFSALAWQLWLAGYPVALSLIRAQLKHAAGRLAGWMQWFRRATHEDEISEEGLALLERYADAHLRVQPLRRIRKRVGREHFPTFLRALIELAVSDSDEGLSVYDERERLLDLRILALGLGLEKRFVRKQEDFEYYLVQVLLPQLRWFFRCLQEVCWEDVLERATDFDLLTARDNLNTWLLRSREARRYREQLPDDYPRWHINLYEIFCALSTADQALVLAAWLALRFYTIS